MKQKTIIVLIIFILILTGCTKEETHKSDITPLATVTPIPLNTVKPFATVAPTPLSGGVYKSTDNLETYEAIESMSDENKALIGGFEYEKIYYKLVNEPANMGIEYISFWEIGFFVDYANLETEEFFYFKWLAATTAEEYLVQIEELENLADDTSTFDTLKYSGTDYYIHLFPDDKCGIDNAAAAKYYRGEIRWVEDGNCFYMSIRSLDPIDENTIKYLEIERHELP